MKKMIFSLLLAGLVTVTYGMSPDTEIRTNYVETTEAYSDANAASSELINNMIGFAHDSGGGLGPREGWYLIATYPPASSLEVYGNWGMAYLPAGETLMYIGSWSTMWPPAPTPQVTDIWPDSDHVYRYTF